MPFAQVIARESEEADKVKSVVSQEEAAASKEAAGVKAIKVQARLSCNCICCHHRLRACAHGLSSRLLSQHDLQQFQTFRAKGSMQPKTALSKWHA